MTVEEVSLLKQQAQADPMRLVMSFDPTLVFKHQRIQATDFDEFRLVRWAAQSVAEPAEPEKVFDEIVGAIEGQMRQALVNHRLFEETYGKIGEGFAHVHRLKPLRSGERITSLSGLAVVCANCHSMIHRGGECRAITGFIPGRDRRRGAV